jgi:GH25 family lysozyme M1 (1,4-beta-N-acetylmuramidase)
MQIKFKGIDISHWQKSIKWSILKNNIDFCIIKAGGSDKTDFFYEDPKFREFYTACKNNNIPVGCYWFAGKNSLGTAAGIREAKYLLAMIKGLKFEMPLYLDFELGKAKNKERNTQFCRAFLKTLEHNGYFAGLYSSDISGFRDTLDIEQLYEFSLWVARYGKQPEYISHYHVWQYSSKGHIDGIYGNVDLDNMYVELPKIIKSKHFNGF